MKIILMFIVGFIIVSTLMSFLTATNIIWPVAFIAAIIIGVKVKRRFVP